MGRRTRARCNAIENDGQTVMYEYFRRKRKKIERIKGQGKIEDKGAKTGEVPLPFVAL